MTVRDYLLGVSSYPIPMRTVEAIALKRTLDLDVPAEGDMVVSPSFRLALADLYVWLYGAPNVSQGGQSYSFTAEQRDMWKRRALGIYGDLGEEDELTSLRGRYGYMGDKL